MDVARAARAESRSPASGLGKRVATDRQWLAAGVCLAATLCFWRFGFSGEALIASLFAGVLVVLAAIDVDRRIVPNRIVLPAIAVVLAGELLVQPDHRLEYVLATVGAGLFLLVPFAFYPAGLGLGDVKLAMLLGAGLGAAVVTAFVVGFMAAFFFAVAILVSRGSAGRKVGIPFVPFLAAGGLVALLLL
jgi:leader peptidase (prepilin peptidase)/N-methyltransferase